MTVSLPVKLTSTNYLLWKAQIVPILCVYDLLGHVDGSSTPPFVVVDGNPNNDFLEWTRHDQVA